MVLIIVRMKMASSQTRTVAHTSSLGNRMGVSSASVFENHEELTGAAPDGPHQRRIDARQRLPAVQRLPTHLNEVTTSST